MSSYGNGNENTLNPFLVTKKVVTYLKSMDDDDDGRAVGKVKRLNVASLNSHLICVLCSGYYIEATAIIECLHTFCRSCIIKYLQSNKFCPICDVQIHEAKPWASLKPDKILQDLVYKLVPGLYQNEMRRRRQFYTNLGKEPENEKKSGKGGGAEEDAEEFFPLDSRFFSQDDSISLSLEYYNESEANKESQNFETEKTKDLKEKPKRYLQCPAAVTVRHLKKFLRMKYGIGLDCWVDIIYNDECLPEEFSLIDVAYTFTWKRTSPMRFAYRIYSKRVLRAIKLQENYQAPRIDEEDKKKSKYQSSLEQQKQNEYLGNFNLNPTNSNNICKTQNYTKSKNSSIVNNNNNNNNNASVKNNNNNNTRAVDRKQSKENNNFYKALNDFDEQSKDKFFQSSEDSNNSGLQIISEKDEDSVKDNNDNNSEDSKESCGILDDKTKKKNLPSSVSNLLDDAIDSFSVKKLLRNKHKLEGKKSKRKSDEIYVEKRKKSFTDAETSSETDKKFSLAKRRRSVPEEHAAVKHQKFDGKEFEILSGEDDFGDETLGNLKNEALRKVFVAKDKPELSNNKKKDGESRKKKRKKSKHHEGEMKKRKSEMIASSPSVMSFGKDPLKLKVKLTPNRPVVETAVENNDDDDDDDDEEEEEEGDEGDSGKPKETKELGNNNAVDSDREIKRKPDESEMKKLASDKERLLHLRAVRHKTIINKTSPKDYINAPPSLTISKIDSSEQQPVKSTLVESRPSLEIMLVSPTDNVKSKKIELSPDGVKDSNSPKVENPGKDVVVHQGRLEVVDNFGVLDLSEKSTRIKESNSLNSNSSSPKEIVTEGTVEKCRKTTHQSILQVAQTLVNRKLSPMMTENHAERVNFDGSGDSSARAAAMRNLKTLSDTAVNILMAAQNKSFINSNSGGGGGSSSSGTEIQKRSFSSIPSSVHKSLTSPNSTKTGKDCENNGSGIKIPVFSVSRDRTNPIPPIPNLHEIYPRNRGRPPIPLSKPGTTAPPSPVKSVQNQTVRQIPNPFVVLNRQTNNQNQNVSKSHSPNPPKMIPSLVVENGETLSPAMRQKLSSIPPLQSIKTKLTPLSKGVEDVVADAMNGGKKSPLDFKETVPKLLNNNNNNNNHNNQNNHNTKTVQNNMESNFFAMKNGGTGGGDEKKSFVKLNSNGNNNNNNNNNNANSIRKIENMAKNIESVAAGLTARAVSNAMIDAK